MSNDLHRDTAHVVNSDSGVWLGHCALQPHDACDPSECEVRQAAGVVEELTAGQIKIGVATAIAGLIVSSVFALGVLTVWLHHAFQGTTMPDIPFLITSIASAPFAAGVITTLRIPRKAKVKLVEAKDE